MKRPAMPPDPTDHETWRLVEWLQINSPWLFAGLITVPMVMLRAYLDKAKVTRQDFAEALICGVFVMASRPFWMMFGMGEDWAVFVGVVTGILGIRFFRPVIESAATKILQRGGRSE